MEEETRRKAIERYLGGESPKSIYEDLKRTKQWFFKWLRRYQSGDPYWCKSKSRAPVHRPFQIDETRREQIISVRKHLESQHFAQIGVSAIKWELKKAGIEFPSDRTISRVLSSEGLVKKNSLYAKRG
jgi:putative transposase